MPAACVCACVNSTDDRPSSSAWTRRVSGGPDRRLRWSFRREMVVRELQSMNGFSAPTMCQVLFRPKTGKGPYPQELTF